MSLKDSETFKPSRWSQQDRSRVSPTISQSPAPTPARSSLKRRKPSVPHALVIDGKDVTPKLLSPELYQEKQISRFSALEIISDQIRDRLDRSEKIDRESVLTVNVLKSHSTVRFADIEKLGTYSSVNFKGSLLSSLFDSLGNESIDEVDSYKESRKDVTTDDSSTTEEDQVIKIMKPPTHVELILNETNTICLLDIPSATVEEDTDEGIKVEQENNQYIYLTEGKGRNRKTQNAETQTSEVIMKSRYTVCTKVKKVSKSTFASNWVMYDTYQEQEEIIESENEDEWLDVDYPKNKTDDVSSLDTVKICKDEKDMIKLIKNPKFLEAVSVIERLLANNCYSEQQKIFRGLTVQDDFRDDIKFKYNLKLLWTFANEKTKGKSVNCLHWNPANKDILAVGYGSFYYMDNSSGAILIWNIKNPVQPERSYYFENSVTSVKFSTSHPMLLAAGFYLGAVIVLNIISREQLIVGQNIPTFEAAWDLTWLKTKDEELIIAAFDDGTIVSYSPKKKMECSNLMKVAKADGKLKGIETMTKCVSLTVPASHYSSAHFTRLHSDQRFYYIGTNEGVIHTCSFNYLNRHLDLFRAHDGAVREMKFSPFTNRIFATCGDDWHTRVWAKGISEPLFELYFTMQSIEGFDWSPTHSTILVDIRGQDIQIWDFQRKVYRPQSITTNPLGCRNTAVQFTDSGTSLIVGDVDGNVHVFALEDMPFPAFFQENLLFESFYVGLKTEPELLKKLKQIRRQLFNDRRNL